MNERVLQFTLGPVQGFVGQARRTRDYWAGSFLLSYLAGHAMSAVLAGGGRIEVPSVGDGKELITDALLSAIWKRNQGEPVGTGPYIATLPNRFQAVISDEFSPAQCVTALENGWKQICDLVWRKFVEPVVHLGKGTEEIWDRQTGGFWDINWVIGDDLSLLDRRKNWRSYVPTVEEGDKCSVMGSLQELSGHLRGPEQKRFWAALRERVPGYDLREDERLCAISLVKRLFPYIAESAIGWPVPQNYPSTPYVAAVHWLDKVIRTVPEQAKKYGIQAQKVLGEGLSEDPEVFSCLREALKDRPEARAFARLNGRCFFESALENPVAWETGKTEGRRGLVNLLKDLNGSCGTASPFYSLLVMDGDEMGALLREYKPKLVSKALGEFASRVPGIVSEHNGVTVYAGGDDVLALLPLEDALAAAVALHKQYASSFESVGIPANRGTLSGAIVYAHYVIPLKTVIQEGHRLLDQVAKDTTGRDSLAVSVLNTGGVALTWSAPWSTFVTGDGTRIEDLIDTLSVQQDDKGEYNSTFFYNLRERFSVLASEEKQVLSDEDTVDLLAVEYRRNHERVCSVDEARERMRRLLGLCRRFRRVSGEVQMMEGSLDFTALILARFLAQKGVNW